MSEPRRLSGLIADRFEQAGTAAPMVRHHGQDLGNQELIAASAAVAAAIKSLGMGPRAHIGLLLRDSYRIVQAAIGIMAEECVFVPLDPSQPAVRLAEMAREAGLVQIFADSDLALLADAALGKPAMAMPIADPAIAVQRQDLVAGLRAARALPTYIYFTTGSTGEPKPVLGRADSLMHFIDWEIEEFGLGTRVRVAQLTPPWHDPFLRDVFVPLVCGGTICIPPDPSIVVSPGDLADWLKTEAVELVHCTPTVFRSLARANNDPADLASLKHILIAGEPLRGTHLAPWYARMGDRVSLVNLYGPTETTLAKLFHRIATSEASLPAIPIGKPMPDTTIRIMSDAQREAAPGEVGELVVETAFGSLGYFGKPAATALAFAPDPAKTIGQPIAYRTGDLVRRLPDGDIEYVDRLDRRLKLHGRQIDLASIEVEILRRPAIRDCVAAIIDSDDAAPRLALFYVAEEEIDERAMRMELAGTLVRGAVPDLWIRVAALPQNRNAKLDHGALVTLAARSGSEPEAGHAGTPSLTGRLTKLWGELLDASEIDPDATFVDLGGDSLAIMLLIAHLESEFDYCLSLWDVFDDLTVSKLAGLIDAATPQAGQATDMQT